MILLDTNILSGLRRPDRVDPALARWAAVTSVEEACLSAATIFEIERGILLLEQRVPSQGAGIRKWLEGDVLTRYAERILPIDAAVARRCAALHVPLTRPPYDALIAATALVHNLTVITRDTADFASMGVALFNPWEAA